MGYYQDNQTHHFVFTFNASTGQKLLYVDGQNPSGFVGLTNFTTALEATGTDHSIEVGSVTSYRKVLADINHINLYNAVMQPRQVYQHYLELQTGATTLSYTENETTPTIDNTSGNYDAYDFAPGTDLTYNDTIFTPGVSIDQLSQLQRFPSPRYKSGNTLIRLFNWFGIEYLSGNGGAPPTMNVTNVGYLRSVVLELITNWNYMVPVVKYFQQTSSAQLSNTTGNWNGMLLKLANDNPNIPAQLITLRAQISGGNIKSTTLPNNHYLQNGSGTFLTNGGVTTSNPSLKVWRPVESTLSTYRNDGELVKNMLTPLLAALSGRTIPKIEYINENGEVIFPYGTTTLDKDTTGFIVERNAAGLDSQNMMGRTYRKLMRNNYADIFMTAVTLSGSVFTEYGINGTTDSSGEPYFRKKWSQAKEIHWKINNKSYPNGDFYPRYPHNWRNWSSAFNGLQHFVQAKYEEITVANDSLMSPFVSAGWDKNELRNMRPAQFLGLLKILGVFGSEFFYAGFFNESAPFPDPKNYIWQISTSAYAQAIVSRFEDILRNGELLDGDYPRGYDPPQTNGPGYSFYTGDLRKYVSVRKHNSKNEYIIAGSLNPVNNFSGGVESSSVCTIYLDGVNPFSFNVRRQGSVYFYKSGANPVFYQLDEWHEEKHPYYWSSDILVNAPVYDYCYAPQVEIKTTGQTDNYTFTSFTSYISFTSTTRVEYTVNPRTAGTYYLWTRARSHDGISTSFDVAVNGGTSKRVSCIKNNTFGWYRKETSGTSAIAFTLSAGTNVIRFTGNTTSIEIEKFHLTSDGSDTFYTEAGPIATALPPIYVSSGGTVTLEGPTGMTSYLWTPSGETTQNITAYTTGTYYAQVQDVGGCTFLTNSVDIVISNDPFIVIAVNLLGSSNLNPGDVGTLSASTIYFGPPAVFDFNWYFAPTLNDVWTLDTNSNTILASATGYYMATATHPTSLATMSATPIYLNFNGITSPTGTTTESQISYNLSYSDNDNTFPWVTTNFISLDASIKEYFVFVKMRSRTAGKKTGIKVSFDDGLNFVSLTNISSTSYGWYRVGTYTNGIKVTNDDSDNTKISFMANNQYIDLIGYAISKNPLFIASPFPNYTY